MTSPEADAAPTDPSIRCNICGGADFIDMKARKRVRCAACGSLERTRLMWMFLERTPLSPDDRILHVAPESGLHKRLSARVKPGRYVGADINPARYSRIPKMKKIDLCALDDQPSDRYDLIVHAHVLEHTPCNIAYTLYHLHRMLTPTGKHICVIPFGPGRYDECFADIGDKERTRRFGQHDHVRRFGAKDIDKHLGAVMALPRAFDATKLFPEEALRGANIPEPYWRGFTTSTVLVLSKYDMKFLERPAGAALRDAGPSLFVRAARHLWRPRA